MRSRRRAERQRVTWQAVSFLLCYPDERLWEHRPLLRDALPSTVPASRPHLAEFLTHLESTDPRSLAEHYVATFDLRRRCCLYLTYYSDGDTRRRGEALAALKQRYREAGVELSEDELPDFLPVVAEFAALHGGESLLVEHRAGMELLRMALEDRGSPYAAVVRGLCASLPGSAPRDQAEARRLAAAGPPAENVGLEPFTPGGAR
ncbi:nitrate reductase molybdenum cofactor assembly chaperone [Spiractinospora alimapuensis]|uniref:nitrate reductase molybdenum cofactor assembly chaperone n=1 Tax=Spiractinospora alimapuensis TaxID=2820884 RepID=UPI001F4411EF|nr:nitrate reductase molybdenum cofactor assembly chaperone [Spiractinospora alimapuensis]QVQ50113.1 nitrate reductase molybdenum cofactor assembly chaperone [Spiractinospora alimapuensis]